MSSRLLFLFMAILSFSRASSTEPSTVEVRFKLTDLDYKPMPGASVRLVLGSAAGWQTANAGVRFVTDAGGTHRYESRVALEERTRKRPTNFVSSLLSRPEAVDHLQIAAELEYAGFRWLYVASLDRFQKDGDVVLHESKVFTRDTRGDFTIEAKFVDGGWRMADLGGLALTTPGHEAWKFSLQPDEADTTKKRWILELSFKRSPDPVRR